MESLATNVLLRLALGDVPEQSQAAVALVAHDREFAVAGTALVELVFALEHHYRLPRSEIQRITKELLEVDNLRADSALAKAALSRFAGHPALSFADCYLAEESIAAGNQPLWTFDRKLANQHPAARLVPPASDEAQQA
ncbi:MAG: hypothetical protein LBC97_08500 [Bifidobacteriaceae bacterium]|nr:hypothetical protein [Bifidobacteriaceae bacterium]